MEQGLRRSAGSTEMKQGVRRWSSVQEDGAGSKEMEQGVIIWSRG